RDFLGATLEAIAGEKAGIVKPGVAVVTAEQPDAALRPIARAAAKARATLTVGGRDWSVHEEHGRLVYQDEASLLDLPLPRLPGRHQHQNAGLAIAALRRLSQAAEPAIPALSPAALERGVAQASWPARLQRLQYGSLARLVGAGELWLDGGHNPHAAAALAASLAELEERAQRPLVLVCGMLNTKDPKAFLERFQGLAGRLIAVPVQGTDAGIAPRELAEIAASLGFEAAAEDDLAEAIRHAAKADPAPRVLVCGSLYLAGEVLGRNGTPPD
ncbi:MAG: cyanophycin synthetase, partial [Pseudomonadota bacterium]